MQMKRMLMAAAIASAMIGQAQAGQWNVGAGFSNFDIDDISLNAVDARLGYAVQIENSAFSVMPELRLGVGVGDEVDRMYLPEIDDTLVATAEIDSLASFGVRLGYDVNDTVSLFVEPTLTKIKATVTASVADYSESESETSDWEYGTGLGVAFNLGERHGIEVGYDHYSDADVVSAAYRYRF